MSAIEYDISSGIQHATQPVSATKPLPTALYNEAGDRMGTPDDPVSVSQGAVSVTTLLNAVTATGAGNAAQPTGIEKAFQASGTTGSGSGSASIAVQVSNDNTNWLTLGTISLTLGTSATSDGFVSAARWKYVRGNVTAISGTGAAVTLTMGS